MNNMKNSIKREQSQACLNFAERKNFRLQAKHKILMTLALLLMAVGGAWAQNVGIAEITSDLKNTWTNDAAVLTATDLPGFVEVESDVAKAFSGELPQTGFTMIIYAFSGDGRTRYVSYNNGAFVEDYAEEYTHGILKGFDFPIYYISESGIEVTWNPATKTGYFTMPTYDVELTPVYAPAADWALVETVKQLPTAAEGIFAGTTDPIVKAGTVALMGDNETPQGVVMYAVTSTNQATAPELSAFSDALPTAKDIADEGAEVLVWYYIKGADTPQGQEATAKNTFNDSEIASIKVTVLSNKFDIEFKAANANTIEAGKATVKVGETAAEVKEGKLTGVKMGSKVTITAKDGYKFRKAEAKKGIVKLLTLNVGGDYPGTLTYAEGETWGQAIENHPTENTGWTIGGGGAIILNYYYVYLEDNRVRQGDAITPGLGYYTE